MSLASGSLAWVVLFTIKRIAKPLRLRLLGMVNQTASA